MDSGGREGGEAREGTFLRGGRDINGMGEKIYRGGAKPVHPGGGADLQGARREDQI